MLNILMIDQKWILEFRTDFLTYIFTTFSAFPSDHFYILVIAVGYWLRPGNLVFRNLGLLVPVSALLSGVLKNLFSIDRPDRSLHLIVAPDSFGFPSGEVQVATVFWLSIFFSMRESIVRYVCFVPILGSILSRVYLGVHSVHDVWAGFAIGYLVSYLFQRLKLQNKLDFKQLLILVIVMIGLCIIFPSKFLWTSMIFASIGALIGFCISFPWIKNVTESPKSFYNMRDVLSVIMCLMILFVIIKGVPTITTSEILMRGSLVVKYCIMMIFLLVVAPKLIHKKQR